MALISTQQTAQHLHISIRTLETWRYRGYGPAYIKLGRCVRYDQTVLEDWLNDNRRNSTSQSITKLHGGNYV